MNKKCVKNAFYFYKQYFVNENQGKTFSNGIRDIETAALASWRRMTLQQRDPFEELAKKAAPIPKVVKTNKNASLSKSIEARGSNQTVHEIVRQSLLHNNLAVQEYHFIAANVFCVTKSNKYIPAELALLKFNLRDGVIRTFHTFINPENIPMGYRFDAMDLSDATHQLPIPPNAKGEKNFSKIRSEINEFIGIKASTIPLFTLEEHIPMIRAILLDVCSSTTNETNCCYEISSINQLFYDLKLTVDGTQRVVEDSVRGASQFKSVDDATIQLNQDKYTYLNAIACQFHDENDCSKYCCLASVKRWAFTISENVCTDLHIRLIAGQHFPFGVETSQQLLKNDSVNKTDKCQPWAIESSKFIGFDRMVDLNANCDAFFLSVDVQQGFNLSLTASFSELDLLREASFGSTAQRHGPGRRGGVNFGEENYTRRCFGRGRGRSDHR